MKLSDIDLFRIATKQGKHGREYAGFYMTDKKEEAEHYISSMNGGCLFEICLSSSAKLLEYGNDITRLKKSDLQEYAKDYDVMVGKNLFGRKEYVLLNKNAVSSFREINMNDSENQSREGRMKMDRNIKIAKELVKLAKSLVAFQHEDVVIGPFRICVRRMALGNMRYPGDFICVLGKYDDMVQIKEELKRIGFHYDREAGWHCFWNKVNWRDVEAVCNAHMARINQNTAPAPVEERAEFEKDFVLDSVGNTFARDFSYQGHYSTIYKKRFVFRDEAGNKYACYLTNKSRTWHCDRAFWTPDGKDFADDLDAKIGQTFHVHGTVSKVTKNATNYEIEFYMK